MAPIRKHKERGNGQELVTRRNPVRDPFGDLFNTLSSGNWWPTWFPQLRNTGQWRQPALDIRDRGHDYQIVAEFPGVGKEDVQMAVSGDRLELRAETVTESEEQEGDYYHREIGSRSFYRTVPLPPDADPDDVDARMENGRLTVTFGKRVGTYGNRKTVKIK